MSSFSVTRRKIVLLLAAALTTQAYAFSFSFSSSSNSNSRNDQDGYTTNRPWGNLGPAKQAPKYQPPQPAPGAYSTQPQFLGAAPGTGWYYQGQMQGAPAAIDSTPDIEVEVADTTVYERQNVVFTVNVVSDGNLAVLDDKLPRIDGATLELIDGPVATTRGSYNYNRPTQIVNTYHYRLTPLRAGEVVIPVIGFEGSYSANNPANSPQGTEFSVTSEAPVTLQVQAADPSVRPWLPLHDLRLQTKLLQTGRLKAGQPVSVVLEQTARGATGNQLPSLADQLQSPDYRVYRDDTVTTSGISGNGRYVTGTRKETFTLIPLEDGWIRLPDINIAWWDIDSGEARLAGVPPTQSTQPAGRSTQADNGTEPLLPLYAWLPMIVALALIAGYMLGTWQHSRVVLARTRGWIAATTQRSLQRGLRVAGRFAPLRHVRRLQTGFALLMPESIRVWMCTRCIATEENPHAWCAEFRERICQDLSIKGHASLSRITEHLIETSPHAEPARLRALVQELEGALYGGLTLDFPAWKREMQQQLRPGLQLRRRARARGPRNRLPVLNPVAGLKSA